MPSGQNEGIANAFTYIEGTANFPYQILLVSFHLQYRNAYFHSTNPGFDAEVAEKFLLYNTHIVKPSIRFKIQ